MVNASVPIPPFFPDAATTTSQFPIVAVELIVMFAISFRELTYAVLFVRTCAESCTPLSAQFALVPATKPLPLITTSSVVSWVAESGDVDATDMSLDETTFPARKLISEDAVGGEEKSLHEAVREAMTAAANAAKRTKRLVSVI